MNIETIEVGELETNCYIAYDPQSKEAIVIDPGDESGKILDLLGEKRLIPLYIVITHGHPDHTGGAEEIHKATGAKILIHEEDAKVFNTPSAWLKYLFSSKIHIDKELKEGDVIKFGGISFAVIHTPGHSKGSMCLYSKEEKALFSGDTLFYDAVGRTDLPWSSEADMKASLKKLLELPPETKVLPGHGWSSTIGQERVHLGGKNE